MFRVDGNDAVLIIQCRFSFHQNFQQRLTLHICLILDICSPVRHYVSAAFRRDSDRGKHPLAGLDIP